MKFTKEEIEEFITLYSKIKEEIKGKEFILKSLEANIADSIDELRFDKDFNSVKLIEFLDSCYHLDDDNLFVYSTGPLSIAETDVRALEDFLQRLLNLILKKVDTKQREMYSMLEDVDKNLINTYKIKINDCISKCFIDGMDKSPYYRIDLTISNNSDILEFSKLFGIETNIHFTLYVPFKNAVPAYPNFGKIKMDIYSNTIKNKVVKTEYDYNVEKLFVDILKMFLSDEMT